MSSIRMKFLLSLLLLVFLSKCGFKPINQNYFSNYQINIQNIQGDKRVAYLLKSKLNSKNDSAEKFINLNLKLDKTKNIKEKNIKNEITKYEITITVNVKLNLTGNNISKEFTVSKSKDFNVNDKYSTTLNNEKAAIRNIVEDVSEKIINNVLLILNDT